MRTCIISLETPKYASELAKLIGELPSKGHVKAVYIDTDIYTIQILWTDVGDVGWCWSHAPHCIWLDRKTCTPMRCTHEAYVTLRPPRAWQGLHCCSVANSGRHSTLSSWWAVQRHGPSRRATHVCSTFKSFARVGL